MVNTELIDQERQNNILDLIKTSLKDEERDSSSWSGGVDIEMHSDSIDKTTKNTISLAFTILLVGSITSTVLLYNGITNEQKKYENFEKQSQELTSLLIGSLNDYEQACSWIHQSCRDWRDTDFKVEDFRITYEYIKAGGLDFYAMEWVPNITHAERPLFEKKAGLDFAQYEGVNYTGIRGLIPENPESMVLISREEQPFYFPIQFFEPLDRMQDLTCYDVYSAPWEQPSVELALKTWKPVATPGFKIVGSGEQESFTVVLYHPGVPLPGKEPRDLSNILIQIKALLERTASVQSDSLGIYIFDKTEPEEMVFLGGMDIKVHEYDADRELIWYPDRLSLEDVKGRAGGRIHVDDISFGARTWAAVIIPIDGGYKSTYIFVLVGGVLIFVASLLLAIWMVYNMRQRAMKMHKLITKAAADSAIVSGLFPANVRQRLFEEATDMNNSKKNHNKDDGGVFNITDGRGLNSQCRELEKLSPTCEEIFGSKPIADLYPHTTIMFADLCGFTAWSSTRDPTQVFTLLEILYHGFDSIARRRRVFKLETIGDCYVAVAGLPEPRDDHAVVMARFAMDCLNKMQQLCKALTMTLGAETGELGLRVGLHSGEVTAGVLRGDKGRFQLFGDTMNTASRMESTGVRNSIQCSAQTADLLSSAGHQNWLTPRSGQVEAKGKGLLTTYFVRVTDDSPVSSNTSECNSSVCE